MKKTYYLLILLISSFNSIYSQEWTWTKNFQNNDYLAINNTFIDSDNNIYTSGTFNTSSMTIENTIISNSSENTTNPNVQYTDCYISKYDSNGNLIFIKHFTGSKFEFLTSITYDGSDYFYVTGYYEGNIVLGQNTYQTENGESKSFVAKFDLNGNVIWSKVINYHGNSILEYKNGFLYLAGVHTGNTYTYDNLTTPSTNYLAVVESMDKTFIAKLDLSGNALWLKSSTYNGTPNIANAHRIGTQPKALTIDNLGNVYVAGFFFSPTTTFGTQTLTKTGTTGNGNLYLAKYESNGNFAWAIKPTTAAHTAVSDLKSDSQNNIYLMGNLSNSSIAFGASSINFPGNSGTFIAKYTSAGTVSWLKGGKISSDAQPNVGLGMNYFHKMHIDSNDNIHVSGVFSKYINFGNNYAIQNSDWTSNMFSIKFDTSGNASNFLKIGDVSQSREIQILKSDGNLLYYSGKLNDPSITLGSTILQNNTGGQTFIAKRDISLSSKEFSKSNSIYPNPTSSMVIISNFQENTTCTLFDLTGKKMKQMILKQSSFSVENLEKGIYILQIENDLSKENIKLVKN